MPRRNRRRRSRGHKNRQPRSSKNKHSILKFIEEASSQKATPQQEQQQAQSGVTFADFNLHPKLFANLSQLGFTQPTPIQEASIQPILEKKDILGVAHTGTGKTGAFLIPLVHKLFEDDSQKIIIIAPTRELAIQIFSVFNDLTKNSHLRAVSCIGGKNLKRQSAQLRKEHHAVIGTPGRLLDLLNRKKLSLREQKTLVLDEVDRMLDMGFVHDIKKIMKHISGNRQNLYFSATMNNRVSQLISEFSNNVEHISVKQQKHVTSVNHKLVRYQSENAKFDTLHDILRSDEVTKSVIFGRTKHGVKRLMYRLKDHGYKVDSIHGNRTQKQRQRSLASFKDSQVTVLVATDVAARGIDVDDISHVINYDLPQTVDDYIHRSGRTSGAGKTGTAYTFVK